MNELTIEFANKPNPVENYIGQVIADAENGFASYTWEVMPDLSATEQGLYFCNTQNCLHATLIRRSGEDFILYSLTVRREDGEIEFTSTDLDFEQEDSTSLGQLYCAVQAAIAKAAWEKAKADYEAAETKVATAETAVADAKTALSAVDSTDKAALYDAGKAVTDAEVALVNAEKAMKEARKAVLYTVEDLKALWDKEYDVLWDWNGKM